MRKIIAIFTLLIGLASGGIFIYSGSFFVKIGLELSFLQSVAGNSLAEAYYQNIGKFIGVLRYFAYGCGGSIIALSIGIFGLLFFYPRKEQVHSKTTSNN
jgi:hypothetical protein